MRAPIEAVSFCNPDCQFLGDCLPGTALQSFLIAPPDPDRGRLAATVVVDTDFNVSAGMIDSRTYEAPSGEVVKDKIRICGGEVCALAEDGMAPIELSGPAKAAVVESVINDKSGVLALGHVEIHLRSDN